MRWLREYRVELACYGPLIFALALMLAANYAWGRGSLKDELPNPYGLSEPVKRTVRGHRVPFPTPGYANPEREAFLSVPPKPDAPTQRRALVRCASFYAIYQKTLESVDAEEAEDMQRRGVAALAKSQSLAEPAEGYVEEMEEIFRQVFQEYVLASSGRGVPLFDRYSEACDNLTDELIER